MNFFYIYSPTALHILSHSWSIPTPSFVLVSTYWCLYLYVCVGVKVCVFVCAWEWRREELLAGGGGERKREGERERQAFTGTKRAVSVS